MTRYTSATAENRAAMLAEIGVESVDELFGSIPETVRLDCRLHLPLG